MSTSSWRPKLHFYRKNAQRLGSSRQALDEVGYSDVARSELAQRLQHE